MINFPERHLDADEINTLTTQLVEVQPGSNDEYITAYFAKIKTCQTQLSHTLGRQKNSAYTALLKEKDKIRDNFFVVFRDSVKIFIHMDDEAQVKAASQIITIIKDRGYNLHRFNYQKESSALNVLFQELDKIQATVALLPGIPERLAKLKQAEADFTEIYNEKLEEEAKKEYITISTCRDELDFYISGLIEFIEKAEKLFPGRFIELAKKIDIILKPYNTIAQSRQTRNLAADKTDKEDDKGITVE